MHSLSLRNTPQTLKCTKIKLVENVDRIPKYFSKRLPIPDYRYRIADTELPIPDCRYRIADTGLPIPTYTCVRRAAGSEVLVDVLPHRRKPVDNLADAAAIRLGAGRLLLRQLLLEVACQKPFNGLYRRREENPSEALMQLEIGGGWTLRLIHRTDEVRAVRR